MADRREALSGQQNPGQGVGGPEATRADDGEKTSQTLTGQNAMPKLVEIPGRYEDVREYACGGIGRVLLVRDRDLDRQVALKELLPEAASGTATAAPGEALGAQGVGAARFLREARITGQLEHPSIVPVYELGRRADGTLYYTMKLVHGETLERAIADAGSMQERLELLPHFLDLCQAIAYAHSRGVIHRDLKPANVMIGEFGETVVIDWGLAKVRGQRDATVGPSADSEGTLESGASDGMTRDGRYLGTPHYMPPEQARGDLDHIAEPSDVYALGAVLYELITGRRPFVGKTADEIVARIVAGGPDPIRVVSPEASAELVAICEKAMQPEPSARYASAKQLAEEIQRFQRGAMVTAHRYGAQDLLRRFARRHRAILGTAAVAGVILVVMAAFALNGILQEQARTERALYYASISLARADIDNRRLDDAYQALVEAPQTYRGFEWGLLARQSRPQIRTLRRHKDKVDHGVFSPDGTQLLTCGRDGRAIVWDEKRPWAIRHVFVDLDEPIHRVAWSANGALLATCTDAEEITIWDAKDYRIVQKLGGYAPAFSRDSRIIAAATQEGRIVRLYDASSGNVVHTLAGPATHIVHLALSNNGKRAAAAVNDGAVWVWPLDSGTPWHADAVHAPSARFVIFSPDDTHFVTAGADRLARLWNADTATLERVFEGHAATIHGVAFDPEGKHVFTCSDDRTVRVWDLMTGETLRVLDGFPQPVEFIALSPDGSRFLTHWGETNAVLWLTMSLEERYTFGGVTAAINSIAFGPEGRLLAAGTGNWRLRDDDRVVIWDTRRREIKQMIRTGRGPVHSVCFLADGAHIATGNQDGTASLYTVENGECRYRLSGHTDTVRCVAVSPDERTLATASWDGTAILWDLATGRRRVVLEGNPRRLDTIAFHPDGDRAATGGMDGAVRFWDTATGTQGRTLEPAQPQRVSTLAFSRDGTRLVTGGDRGRLTLWDLDRGCVLRNFSGHSGIVYAVALSADGLRMISGGKDGAVRIWDTETGRQILHLERHTDCVNALALSSNGRFLATGGRDATAILWPIAPWKEAG